MNKVAKAARGGSLTCHKLVRPFCKTNITSSAYNTLTEKLKRASSLNTFKHILKNIYLKQLKIYPATVFVTSRISSITTIVTYYSNSIIHLLHFCFFLSSSFWETAMKITLQPGLYHHCRCTAFLDLFFMNIYYRYLQICFRCF